MDHAMHPENMSQLEWRPELLAGYTGPLIPGTAARSVSLESMQLQVQELETADFMFGYQNIILSKSMVLTAGTEEDGLFAYTQLKSTVGHQVNGLALVQLEEEAFTTYRAKSPVWCLHFNNPGEYSALEMRFSEHMLDAYLSVFPKLAVPPSLSALLYTTRPSYAGFEMIDIIKKMLSCPYEPGFARLYLDLLVRQYLMVMLQQVFRKPAPKYRFTRRDVERLNEARALLLQDLTRKSYSIAELARAVGINEFKLKAGFRELFGKGVFECLHEHRMALARELLLNTDKPIKEICTLTGYPRITNFITAFRRTFGYTPGALRRNQQT